MIKKEEEPGSEFFLGAEEAVHTVVEPPEGLEDPRARGAGPRDRVPLLVMVEAVGKLGVTAGGGSGQQPPPQSGSGVGSHGDNPGGEGGGCSTSHSQK